MIKVLVQADGVSINGRKYSKEARAKMVEQHQDKLVFASPVLPELRLADAVGRVAGMSLAEDGSVLADVEPINEHGEMLIGLLADDRARLYTIGTARPQDVDGVQTVGEDYVLQGVGIELADKDKVPDGR